MTDNRITSAHNQRLKELRKLHDRKHRERTGSFLAEGEDLLQEALRWRKPPEAVFHDPDQLPADAPVLLGLPSEVELIPVEGDVLRRSGSLGSGSRVIGVWRQKGVGLGETAAEVLAGVDVALYLHEVADPGNVGAVLRSAIALVPCLVVMSPGTADPYSPKAVRASMGAVFGQPTTRASFDEVRSVFPGRRMIGLSPQAERTLHETDLSPPIAFCLGSERHGLPEGMVAGCDEVCRIAQQAEGAESLNVAMVATLCLYEVSLHKLSSSR
jgi:TrmH family RNA methyltransferase